MRHGSSGSELKGCLPVSRTSTGCRRTRGEVLVDAPGCHCVRGGLVAWAPPRGAWYSYLQSGGMSSPSSELVLEPNRRLSPVDGNKSMLLDGSLLATMEQLDRGVPRHLDSVQQLIPRFLALTINIGKGRNQLSVRGLAEDSLALAQVTDIVEITASPPCVPSTDNRFAKGKWLQTNEDLTLMW
uniref:Uncharacterized protein n=1 Tax=Oryza meridionalis TaxID=40149 RepID=A0A0E0C6G8_9ORYZ